MLNQPTGTPTNEPSMNGDVDAAMTLLLLGTSTFREEVIEVASLPRSDVEEDIPSPSPHLTRR